MKKLIIYSLLFIGTYGFSQNNNLKPPNYKSIKKKIALKNSNLYYPKLMEKYKNADTTMTLDEKRHLYYGFIHQKEYSPYTRSDYTDSLRTVLKKENYTKADLKKIITHSDAILKDNPLSLKAINYKLYAKEKLQDSLGLLKDYTQMRMITDAMLSSGDGLSKDTAFFVISPTHEDSLLQLLGYKFGGEKVPFAPYDYLTLAENEDGIEGLYFDISACLNHMNNLFN